MPAMKFATEPKMAHVAHGNIDEESAENARRKIPIGSTIYRSREKVSVATCHHSPVFKVLGSGAFPISKA
jgi:hypothetical protein